MKATKAIIATGGFGTRFGVAAISGEKCMALVDGVPVLQRVVEDCVAGGIKEITLVVGSMSHQSRLHFGGNPDFEAYLAAKGKKELLDEAKRIRTMAKYTFVEQKPEHPYGTSTPLWLARAAIPQDPDERFLYLFGDQLYHHTGGGSEAAHLLARTERAGTHAGMLAMEVPPHTIDQYGIVTARPWPARDGTPIMDQIIEKPAVGSVASSRNNGSFFALTNAVLPHLEANMANRPDGTPEHYFTDVMNAYAENNSVAVIEPMGTYLDCGNPNALLKANNFVADARG